MSHDTQSALKHAQSQIRSFLELISKPSQNKMAESRARMLDENRQGMIKSAIRQLDEIMTHSRADIANTDIPHLFLPSDAAYSNPQVSKIALDIWDKDMKPEAVKHRITQTSRIASEMAEWHQDQSSALSNEVRSGHELTPDTLLEFFANYEDNRSCSEDTKLKADFLSRLVNRNAESLGGLSTDLSELEACASKLIGENDWHHSKSIICQLLSITYGYVDDVNKQELSESLSDILPDMLKLETSDSDQLTAALSLQARLGVSTLADELEHISLAVRTGISLYKQLFDLEDFTQHLLVNAPASSWVDPQRTNQSHSKVKELMSWRPDSESPQEVLFNPNVLNAHMSIINAWLKSTIESGTVSKKQSQKCCQLVDDAELEMKVLMIAAAYEGPSENDYESDSQPELQGDYASAYQQEQGGNGDLEKAIRESLKTIRATLPPFAPIRSQSQDEDEDTHMADVEEEEHEGKGKGKA